MRSLALGFALALTACGAKTGLDVPPAVDVCFDGWDGDGDGAVDEGCPCEEGSTQACYSGPPVTTGIGACAAGAQTCVVAGDGTWSWGACAGETLPADEDCTDGIDNDCDERTDCADVDCRRDPTCEPVLSRAELCDGIDNNGDGRADEGQACPQGDGPCPVAGAVRICDAYCGVHQRCRADGTWGPCIVDGVGPAVGCSIHSDCPRGEWCDIGQCISTSTCEADGDCFTEGWCATEQGTCVSECFHHDDCAPPTVCDLGICVLDPYFPSF